MRTCLVITMLVFASDMMQAQDTLYKADGSMHLAKILEVNDTQIKYKIISNAGGPTHVIGKGHVSRIVYESGLTEVFPSSAIVNLDPVILIDPRETDFGRNFISLNILDLIASGTLTLEYEYTFKSGLFSLRVPVSYGFNNREYYLKSKAFGTGLDLNIYASGQGRSKFYFGPSFEYKKFQSINWNEVNSAYAFLFQGGFLFQPQKHFNISVNAGIGYARLIRDDNMYESKGDVATRLGLNIGYKF